MFARIFSRLFLVVCILALSFNSPAVAQSRKGKWGYGDNRFFIIDQVCRDGMEVSAIDDSSQNPPTFAGSPVPINIGARLYTNTAITIPVWSDLASRSPAASYGPQLAPLFVFSMRPEVDPLPADVDNDGLLTSGSEYFEVYMNGEFVLWTEVLTPGARVIATHFSSNDSEEMGYESLLVEDCYFHRLTAGKSKVTTIGSNLLNAGGSLPPAQVLYRLTRLPQNGSLRRNGVALAVGNTFTQADVNAGLLTYQHNGNSALSDTFRFDMAGLALASVNSGGTQGNGDSLTPSIAGDGRKVAFYSGATNLVTGDNNNQADIFVRNVLSGTTVLVSASLTGTVANDFVSVFPKISANGRFVAFASAASNLVAGDTNTCASHPLTGHCPDIFVRDLQTNTTVRVSVDSLKAQANGESANPAISADGRYVVFESAATNLVALDTNALKDVFLHDRDTDNDGIFDETGAVSTARLSVATNGAQAVGGESVTPEISANGQVVAFVSSATNLVGSDTNNSTDIFVRDRVGNTTTRISVSSAGAQSNNSSSSPTLSADGRYVAFASNANNLVSGDSNTTCGDFQDEECGDVFVRDRQTNTTRRVSLGYSGDQVDFGYIDGAALSADGSQVAFTARASNVVFPDSNFSYDVFVHDWVGGTTVRASTTISEIEGDPGNSYYADISDDGQYVAFDSFAPLAPGDPDATQDIYVRYLGYSQTFTIAIRQQLFLPLIRR